MDIVKQIDKIINKYAGLRTKDSESRKSSNPKIKKMLADLQSSLREQCKFSTIDVKATLGSGNLRETPVVYF